MERLLAGAIALGISLSPDKVQKFTRYYHALVDWNRRVNLTSVIEWEQVQTVHFLDSLTVASALPPEVQQGGRLLDVGAGAGFPGLPLKIAFPNLRLGLLESVGKKIAFLREAVDLLELPDVEVYHGRAEELARTPPLRENFDAVVARGLAKMPVLAELTLPFARVGGLVIAQKKGEIAAELERAREAVETLGGGPLTIQWLDVEGLDEPRALTVTLKVAPTPEAYPRRPGVPAKRPLGRSGLAPSTVAAAEQGP